MHFSLQDMVRRTLAEAEEREKIAQAPADTPPESDKKKEEKKQGPPAQASNGSQSPNAPERNEESYEEKTSSVFVEKLASAVEHLNLHFLKEAVGKPEPPTAHTPPKTTVGAGMGATATQTNYDSPTTGMQSEETGQATSQQQAPKNPPSDVSSPGQTNPGTALQTDMNDRPGGSEDWTNKDVQKQASVRKVARVQAIMNKMAADAENPAKLSAGKEPLENPNASEAEQDVPSQPAEVSKQEKMVGGNQAAIDYTKQQAKAVPKARMGEVLDEPAQKKSTDPVLHQNLDAASGAGVKLSSVTKVAAARALLHKIAEEGASEDASPEKKERAAKLQAVLKAKQQDKSAPPSSSSDEGGEEKQSMGMPIGGGY